jgi:alpha-L-fucosidase 2
VVNQWPGGFQAGVTVRAGSAPLDGWTVGWTFPNGQQISQLWSGVVNSGGPTVSVSNVGYNGNLPAGGSTSFGFIGSYSGSNPAPTALTCTSP